MNKLEQAARQVVDAWDLREFSTRMDEAITALREALANLAEQEPVAWWCCVPGQDPVLLFDEPSDERYPPNYKEPLYAAPVSIEAAVVAEREACAKLALTAQSERMQSIREAIAVAIRARGEK